MRLTNTDMPLHYVYNRNLYVVCLLQTRVARSSGQYTDEDLNTLFMQKMDLHYDYLKTVTNLNYQHPIMATSKIRYLIEICKKKPRVSIEGPKGCRHAARPYYVPHCTKCLLMKKTLIMYSSLVDHSSLTTLNATSTSMIFCQT